MDCAGYESGGKSRYSVHWLSFIWGPGQKLGASKQLRKVRNCSKIQCRFDVTVRLMVDTTASGTHISPQKKKDIS